MNVSHVSVMNRVKKYGSELSKIRNPKPVQVMELDEIHSYIGPKNCKWIWIAVDREAREFVDFVIGKQVNNIVFQTFY